MYGLAVVESLWRPRGITGIVVKQFVQCISLGSKCMQKC